MLNLFKRATKSAPEPTAAPPADGGTADEHVRDGLQHHQAGRFREAEAAYADALRLDPQNIDALHFSGVIAYQEGRHDQADRLISQALSRNPANPPAHNNLGNVRVKQGRLAEAIASFERAISLQPDYLDAYFNLAGVRERRNELDEAIACYKRGLSLDPDSPRFCSALANVYVRQHRLDEATLLCRKALTLDPHSPQAHFLLGSVFQQRGERDEAEACYRRAIALKPDFAEAHCGLGHVFRETGRADQAVPCYEQALAADPNHLAAHSGLATALLDLGEFDEAISLYRTAAALNPKAPEVHSNLGNALRQVGRLEQAVASCREALALNPAFTPALCNLGTALEGQEKLEEAIGCYRKALELEPDLAEMHYNLGNALAKAGWRAQALEHFRRALSLNSNYHEARWALTMSQLPAVYDIDEKPEDYRKAFSQELSELERWFDGARLARGAEAVGVQQPFYLAYQERSNRPLLERYGSLCVRIMAEWSRRQGLAAPSNERRKGRPIRVGVVSQHFRNHSVWNAIVRGWFQKLDPTRFALEAFYLGFDHDRETDFARLRAAHFEEGAGGLRQWAQAIVDRRPDVLVYPEIGMFPMTVRLASLRLAPVQIATWGHPETTGLPTIDYYLSAQDMEPADGQAHYTERLVTLPDLGCSYQPTQVAPADPGLAELDSASDAPVFVCPGVPFKYAPQHDMVFTRIARALGRCRFIFFSYQSRELSNRLRRRLELAFKRDGLNFGDFGVFVPWLAQSSFYGLLQRADLLLDTIGFSGFNTAMQAVESALPIVTVEGRFLRGRLASGVLKRVGLQELVASSPEEYVSVATRLARDSEYRKGVRRRIEASRHILFDDDAPIRAMEAFLAEAVER